MLVEVILTTEGPVFFTIGLNPVAGTIGPTISGLCTVVAGAVAGVVVRPDCARTSPPARLPTIRRADKAHPNIFRSFCMVILL
jgi:hypothetical protein